MFNTRPGVVYGFHGLDRDIALKILNGKEDFIHSTNEYDWLGPGIYFWENNYERAKQWAEDASRSKRSSVKTPFVLGAIIDLNNCLDLLDQRFNDDLVDAYGVLKKNFEERGKPLPKNQGSDFDFKLRFLDCAVINSARELAEGAQAPFDSVRAAFIEGDPVYDGAKFYSQSHIQIAVIDSKCIKGVFLPR